MIKQLVFGVVALSMVPSESESASIAEAGEFHTALSEQVCLAMDPNIISTHQAAKQVIATAQQCRS